MKQFYRAVLAIYLLFLLWLVLFKFSADPLSVLANYQSRSLNVIPFAGSSGTVREMLENFIVFVPLGLLVAGSFKRARFWRKVTYIAMLSVAIEVAQFVLAIGSTDVTDVITNTLGGLFGVATYRWLSKYLGDKRLDAGIAITFAVLLAAFGLLRLLVFRVRY